jgi:hypothetical protein
MKNRHRPWIGSLVLAVLGLACAAPAPALAADALPDLVPAPPANARLSTETLADGQSHLLVRFTGYIRNAGPGAVEIDGTAPVNGVMTRTWQRIYQTGGGYRDDASRHPRITFETADGHEHWHVQGAARYSLWNQAGTAEVAPAAKVGFCLEDVEPFDPAAPPDPAYDDSATGFCDQHEPDASDLREGISRGWQDVYASRLPFQWVDVSDTPPGEYRLAAQVDPSDFVIETNESDNGPELASDIVTVPGYTPSPLAVTVKGAQTIPITATRYGAAGPGVFRIESPPRHGKLNFAPGAPITGPVVYKPDSRFGGADRFTFSVHDTASAFPLHSPAAPVELSVAGRLHSSSRHRLLGAVRFSWRGRALIVLARARKTGRLRLRLRKHGRALGSCARRARSGYRFRCRIALLRRSSPRGARLTVTLRRKAKPATVDAFRVPSRLRHRA